MSIDLNWQLANPYGIAMNETEDAWWSGRITDVLELDDGIAGLLVATETGGVWSISTAGTTMPLSNSWDEPDVNCLAAGPDGSRHFYAGCDEGVIYETDVSDPTPLVAWKPIEDPLPTDKGGVPGAGSVNRIVVLRRDRLIIAACDGGLYWSEIPKMPEKRGCCLGWLLPPPPPRARYAWQRAEEEDVGQKGYFGVAVGSLTGRPDEPGEEDLRDVSIVAGGNNGGVFIGRWDSRRLTVRRATLIDGSNIDWTKSGWWTPATGPTSVAVCDRHANHLYAVCPFPDGRLKMVVHSKDGGRQWRMTGFEVPSVPESKDIRIEAGEQGYWNNCIAVAPTISKIVAFGWQKGVFLSTDEGKTWQIISDPPHLHPDIKILLFTPTRDDKHYLYIGSDGGLAQVDLDDFLGGKLTARSDYNRWLPTLLCYCTFPLKRQFYGTLSTSRSDPTKGWVCSGVHDNGNIYCDLVTGTPWQQIYGADGAPLGGDGGWTAFVDDGAMLSNVKGQPVRAARRKGTTLLDWGVAPMDAPPPDYANGLTAPAGDVVRHPMFRNDAGQLMYAVAGAGSNIYGLYPYPAANTYRWELLGTLPHGLTVSQASGGLASHSGSTILVGTNTGRIFALDVKLGSFIEITVVLPKPLPNKPQSGGNPHHIVTLSKSVAFAILNGTNFGNNYVLRLDGLKWSLPKSVGLPIDQYFYGLEGVFQEGHQLVFVSTDDCVYASEDGGDNWVPASHGLPRRPHGGDLRIAINTEQAWLYLGTFGRSVWRTRLPRVHFE